MREMCEREGEREGESLTVTRLQAPYFTDNYRFIHNNVIITVWQTLIPPRTGPATAGVVVDAALFGSPFPPEALTKVDQAGGWTMHAAVRVLLTSAAEVENTNLAMGELRTLKDALKGICELDVIERLALDTRVKTVGAV